MSNIEFKFHNINDLSLSRQDLVVEHSGREFSILHLGVTTGPLGGDATATFDLYFDIGPDDPITIRAKEGAKVVLEHDTIEQGE